MTGSHVKLWYRVLLMTKHARDTAGSHVYIVVQSAFNDLLEQLNGGFPYCQCIAFYLVWPFIDRGEKDRRCWLMKLKNWNTSPVGFPVVRSSCN